MSDVAAILRLAQLIRLAVNGWATWPLLHQSFADVAHSMTDAGVALQRLRSHVQRLSPETEIRSDVANAACASVEAGTAQVIGELMKLLKDKDIESAPAGAQHRSSMLLRQILAPIIVGEIRGLHAEPANADACGELCLQGMLTFDSSGTCVCVDGAAIRMLRLTAVPVETRTLPRPLRRLVTRFTEGELSDVLNRCSFDHGGRRFDCYASVSNATTADRSRRLRLLVVPKHASGAVAGRLITHGSLSRREATVLRHLLDGHTTAAIARQLELSAHTVRTYVERVYDKLSVQNRHELMTLAASMVPSAGADHDER